MLFEKILLIVPVFMYNYIKMSPASLGGGCHLLNFGGRISPSKTLRSYRSNCYDIIVRTKQMSELACLLSSDYNTVMGEVARESHKDLRSDK